MRRIMICMQCALDRTGGKLFRCIPLPEIRSTDIVNSSRAAERTRNDNGQDARLARLPCRNRIDIRLHDDPRITTLQFAINNQAVAFAGRVLPACPRQSVACGKRIRKSSIQVRDRRIG